MSKTRTPRLRHRPLFVEGLEQRTMLAGNVTASVRGGTLFVTGDNDDNAIVIQQTGPNRFTVVGATASDTTVNGRAEGTAFVANGVRNFEIDLRGGDDSLGISNSETFLLDLEAELLGGPRAAQADIADSLTIRGYAHIRTGDGDDAIGMQLRAGAFLLVNSGAGSDAAVIEASTATHLHVQADTGNQNTDGDDYVRIRGVNISRGAVVVNALTGDDTIEAADVNAPAIILNPSVGGTISGAVDFDTVTGVNLTARNIIIAYGGADDDSLTFTDIETRHLLLIGGNGDDTITVGRVDTPIVTLLGEGGDDTITVDDTFNIDDPFTPIDPEFSSFISIVLHIDSGSGDDVVDVNSTGTLFMDIGNMNVVTGTGSDSASLTALTLTGNLHIDLGPGDDGSTTSVGTGLVLSDLDVAGFLHAFLGSGDDAMTVSFTSAGGDGGVAKFFGGEGDEEEGDLFVDGGGNGPYETFDFEFEETLPTLPE